MKFTNKNIEKERKRIRNILFISIALILVAGAFYAWGVHEKDTAKTDVRSMHNLIVSNEKNIAKKNSYIEITDEPYKFAVYKNTTNAYYFVFDKDYMYVAYMSLADYNNLKKATPDKPIKIEGVTKTTATNIKKIGIEVYNDAQTKKEDKLALADFDDYFGSIFLDMTAQADTTVGTTQDVLAVLSCMAGFITLIYALIVNIKFNSGIRKLDNITIQGLDSEMNDSEAFYYAGQHLYLTRNNIINFAGTFRVIPYKDIVWMYPYEYRVNGAKSNQSIIVVTPDGKKNTIASISVITKKKQEAYNEIFNTIASKNPNMILGYSKESRVKAKEKLASFKNK